MRTAAAAEIEILVSLVQVLKGGKRVACGGGGGGDLGSTVEQEQEECWDSAHFEREMSTMSPTPTSSSSWWQSVWK